MQEDEFLIDLSEGAVARSLEGEPVVTQLTTLSEPVLTYFDRGGTGPAVLFAHGVGSSAATWPDLFGKLHGRRLIAADMRGHGQSSVPMGPYSLADLVDDELRVMDALGLDTVSFVGFSIGALIGQALALAHPDRLEALVLLSGVGARTPAEQRRAIERLGVVRSSDPADVARDSVERWFTPRFVARYPRLVEDEIAIVSRTSPLGYAACYEVLATSDLIGELNEIVTPTLVVTGENDVGSTPRMSAEIHQRISASRLIVLPGLRHYIHLEGSGIVADLITGFLDEVAANQIGG